MDQSISKLLLDHGGGGECNRDVIGLSRVNFVCQSNLRDTVHSTDPLGDTMHVEAFVDLLKVSNLFFTESKQCNVNKSL